MSSPMLDRLKALLESGEKMRSFQFPEREGVVYQLGGSNRAKLRGWKDSCLELVGAAVGMDSELFQAFPIELPDHIQGTFHAAMDHYLSILRILREEMEKGAAEEPGRGVPTPFIVEGARRLLDAGYKDAAAIYCRAAFEASLRSLCGMHGVELEEGDSINKMARRLMEAAVLDPDELRAIETWANFANAAAYEKFDQYKVEQVEQMVRWLGEFASRPH